MKKLLMLVGLALFAGHAWSASIPFTEEAEARFRQVEGKKIAKVKYNAVTNGGVSTATYGLGVTLPASAVIVRSYGKINTQFVDNGNGTIALHCETANNIFSAADITLHAAGGLLEGVSSGASTAFKAITSPCVITATVAGSADITNSAGELTFWVEYVVAD